MRAPLYALVIRMTGGVGAGINVLRLAERIGAILGLAASALLLEDIGAQRSVTAVGIIVLVGLALYAIVEATRRLRTVQGEGEQLRMLCGMIEIGSVPRGARVWKYVVLSVGGVSIK